MAGDEDYNNDFGGMGLPQYKLTLTGSAIMVNLNLPEYDETYIENDDLIALYRMGDHSMLMYNSETAGKTQVILKLNSMQVAYLVVEYKPE